MDLDRMAQLFADGPMPLIRADFSSDDAWQRVVDEVVKESDIVGDGDGYTPNIRPISDTGFESITPERLASVWPREHPSYVILADERSMREATSGADLTVALLDLHATKEDEEEFGWVFGRTFRCASGEVAGIEANLSIANMDFAEFADAPTGDGVFRGF